MTGKYPPSSGKSFKVGQNHDGCKAISTTLLVLKWSRAIFWSRSSKPSVPSFYLCPFLCKLRPSGVSLESSGLENIPQVPGNGAKIGQTHHARKAVLATLVALKWGGAIFRPRSSKLSVRSFYLCLFLCTPRPSGVSSESPGLKSIPQVPGNRAKVCQIHHARKAVSATLSVLKWSGAIFRLRSLKSSVRLFYLCPFLCKPRRSKVSLKSPGLENIPQIPGNQAKNSKNHDARKTVSATLSVLN